MNTRCYMVIIKGEIKTSEIMSCGYNRNTQKWDVKFNNGKTYSYAYLNVEKLTDPEVLNPNMYRISREGREFFDVNAIYVFRSGSESYWHICFGDGSERDYRRNDLHIIESCLAQSQSSNVFEYIKQIAGLSNLKNEETGEKLLSKKFDKISFVGSDVALAKYLNPSLLQEKRIGREYIPIFPFGCNNSQYKAVKNAMENQISVIQGPPGTGKTQTILNIIANILMQGKTVQIVSNNNSATENVYEKLSSPKYNLGFVAATLGSSKNKKLFVEHQDAAYPDFSSWKTGEDPSVLQKGIAEQSSQLKSVFDKQEKLACLRQELSQLVTEQEYFNQYVKESDVHTDSITESKIYSIFDYLYKQYTEERRVYLQKHKKVSEYDSENLMYSLIEDIISANKYSSLDVVCHFPLNMLIKNPELLNEQECQYAMNPATHLDFLIYNRIGKKPVLAIEVDGYEYHKEDTVQASRDLLKNHIMELYEIPLLRFMTNGSGEKEKIIEMLDKLVG